MYAVQHVEYGYRWRIIRGYADPEAVKKCLAQSKWLLKQVAECVYHRHGIERYKKQPLGTFSVIHSTLHFPETKRNTGFKNLECYPWLAAGIPDLLALRERTRTLTRDTSGSITIHRYGAFGRLGEHADQEGDAVADDSIAVGFSSVAEVCVKEPDGYISKGILYPGDGLLFDNSGGPYVRPRHTLRNLRLTERFVSVD